MAKSLLNGVNEVLKRVSVIQGDSGVLTTLTDSSRQVYIDIAVQVWNEVIDQLYSDSNIPRANELAENTITLASGDRDYTLEADLVQLHFPLLDETNGQYISEYPGGYLAMVESQPFPDNETGLPYYGAIRPTDGLLYLDKIPQAAEAGRVYKYRYDKDVVLSAAADTFPFSDAVFRSLVPAVAEMWRYYQKNKFAGDIFKASMGRAARLLNKTQQRDSWSTLRLRGDVTDPLDAD